MSTSKLKSSKNLFLGKAEIDRMSQWWKQNNELLNHDAFGYGIVKAHGSVNEEGFRIAQGTGVDKISMYQGTAIAYDSVEGEVRPITVPSQVIDIADVPTDSTDYYVKLKWKTSVLEEGTCSLAATGQLTGVNTKFTEVMRGQPNFPTVIEFEKVGLLNVGEFPIIQVVSDTDAWIANPTQVEADLKYKIIGTFVPDTVIPSGDKEIFEYNSYEVVLEAGAGTNNTDTFLLAKVNSDGATLLIEDMREDWFEDGAMKHLTQWNGVASNTVIGVEWAKYGSQYSDQGYNQVMIGWGIKVAGAAWSLDPSTNTITCTAGSGGVHDDLTSIANFSLTGWRMYFGNTGKYRKILAQTTVAGTIVCGVQSYDHNELPASGSGALMIVPDCDKIAIRTYKKAATADLLVSDIKFFPIQWGEGEMSIRPVGATIRYQQYWAGHMSEEEDINDGDYLNEAAHDADGVVTGATTGTVVGGEITLVLSPLSYATNGMKVDAVNDMVSGGVIQDFYASATVVGTVLGLPATGSANLVACPTVGATIDEIANYGTGTVLTVKFTGAGGVILQQQVGKLDLGTYDGGTKFLSQNSVAVFYQDSGAPDWTLISTSEVNAYSSTYLSLNHTSATADKINLLMLNDANASRAFNIYADSVMSGQSSTVYFPQGNGMLARFNDGAVANSEAWNSYTLTVPDIAVTGGTVSGVGTATVKWKVIGKTLFMRCGVAITQTVATTSSYTLSGFNLPAGLAATTTPSNINVGFFNDTGAGTTNGILSLHSILAGFNIICQKQDGTAFTVGTNTLKFTAIFELA